MQSQTPPPPRKSWAGGHPTPERATTFHFAALVRASKAVPAHGCSLVGSPTTVMATGVGGVYRGIDSPLATARAAGAKSPLSVEARCAS